jgi:hypothetical protein
LLWSVCTYNALDAYELAFRNFNDLVHPIFGDLSKFPVYHITSLMFQRFKPRSRQGPFHPGTIFFCFIIWSKKIICS